MYHHWGVCGGVVFGGWSGECRALIVDVTGPESGRSKAGERGKSKVKF